MNEQTRFASADFAFWIGVALLLISFTLPWVVNGVSALDHSLLDLAEWASLHPQANSGTFPLLPSLLLRLPTVCAVWLIALGVPLRWRIPGVLVTMIFALGLLPPPEFIDALDSGNYRQQFALAVIAFMGVGAGWVLRNMRMRRIILTATALVGAVASLIGVSIAIPLRATSATETLPGLGIGVALIAFITVGAILLGNKTGQNA